MSLSSYFFFNIYSQVLATNPILSDWPSEISSPGVKNSSSPKIVNDFPP